LISSSVPNENVVVVAAPGQALPALPREVAVARDVREGRGPLEGLAAGLQTLSGRADAVYASACDVPLLVPAFVDRMFDLLDDFDAAVPFDDRHQHPLAAVYRPSVLPQVQKLLALDQLSLQRLFDEFRTRRVPVEELRAVDPELSTLKNVNDEEDYLTALRAAGLAT
jgi:molybdopterin-guanine dinucleotide biosynthesis protein A